VPPSDRPSSARGARTDTLDKRGQVAVQGTRHDRRRVCPHS